MAADELCVTQSAVSKQVANLEAFLGYRLFERNHHSLTLTAKGQQCMIVVTETLEVLADRLSELNQTETKKLAILTDTDFAQLWLFPSLQKFERLHPEIEVALSARNDSTPIGESSLKDYAVSWGRGSWRNAVCEPLLTNRSFLVRAPDFFDGKKPHLDLILQEHLIHDRSTYWCTAFIEALDIEHLNPGIGRTYNQTVLCLEAAVRGDGIAIGDEVSSREHLESGRLTIPFPVSLPCPDSYFVLEPKTKKHNREPWQHFRNWLFEEAKEHQLWFSDFWEPKSR